MYIFIMRLPYIPIVVDMWRNWCRSSEKKPISNERKTYQVKKNVISNHITHFTVGLLLAFCWRMAGRLLSVLFMTSVLCCLPHDIMTCFKMPDLLQNGGSSVESPAKPRGSLLKVVMPGNIHKIPYHWGIRMRGCTNKTVVTPFIHVATDALQLLPRQKKIVNPIKVFVVT